MGPCRHSVAAAVLLTSGPRGSLGSIAMRLLMGQCWLIVAMIWHARWAHARPCAEGLISHRWPTPPLRQVSTCLHCRPMRAFRRGSCPANFRPTRQPRQYCDAALDGPMPANRHNDLALGMGPCEAMRRRVYRLLLANSTSLARISPLAQWAHAGIPSRQLSCQLQAHAAASAVS